MRRSFSLASFVELLACGLAALAGAWMGVHARERVAFPRTPLQLPLSYGREEGDGRPQLLRRGEAGRVLPIAQWTARFRALEEHEAWEELAALLDEIEERAPVLYRANRLGYLHARAQIATGDDDEALAHLEPFLAPGDPWRPLALHHVAALAALMGEERQAVARRRELLLEHPGSLYWHDTLTAHLEWLDREGDPRATLRFLDSVEPLAEDQRTQRELAAARVAALLAADEIDEAADLGTQLLGRSTRDAAAERVAL